MKATCGFHQKIKSFEYSVADSDIMKSFGSYGRLLAGETKHDLKIGKIFPFLAAFCSFFCVKVFCGFVYFGFLKISLFNKICEFSFWNC